VRRRIYRLSSAGAPIEGIDSEAQVWGSRGCTTKTVVLLAIPMPLILLVRTSPTRDGEVESPAGVCAGALEGVLRWLLRIFPRWAEIVHRRGSRRGRVPQCGANESAGLGRSAWRPALLNLADSLWGGFQEQGPAEGWSLVALHIVAFHDSWTLRQAAFPLLILLVGNGTT
jgi:hypothetical protein